MSDNQKESTYHHDFHSINLKVDQKSMQEKYQATHWARKQ